MSTPKPTSKEESGVFVWCLACLQPEIVQPCEVRWTALYRPLTLSEYLSMPINIRYKLEEQYKQRFLSST